MPCLYLRYVIVALNVAFVIIVASITLATCLSLSLSTIDANAKTAVEQLGAATLRPTDAFFRQPQQALARLEAAPAQFPRHGMFPSETLTHGEDSLLPWSRTVLSELQGADLKYSTVLANLYDGSLALALAVDRNGQKWPSITVAWPENATHTARVTSVHNPTCGTFNATMTALLTPSLSVLQLPDLRNPQVRAFWDGTYNGASPTPTTSVRVLPLFFVVSTDNECFFALTYVARIKNATLNQGFGFITVYLTDIGSLLTDAQLTAKSRAFLFDKNGFVVAASANLSVVDVADYTINDKIPAGCTTTHEARHWYPSPVSRIACRAHITEYRHHAALASTVHADPEFFTGQLGRLRGTGGNAVGQVRKLAEHYVFVGALSSVASSYGLTFVMLVPETDVLGDSDLIMPVVGGVTAAVVLIVGCVSFALVWIVLRPLLAIAERMGRAARLEPDPEPVSFSDLAEIRGLQVAFVEMRDELARIRAFVPQALLRTSTDEEDREDQANKPIDLLSESISFEVSDSASLTADSPATPHSMTPNTPAPIRVSMRQRRASVATRGSQSQLGSAPPDSVISPLGNHYVKLPASRRNLRTEASIRRENVTVLMINVLGYHGSIGAGPLDGDRAAAMVESVLAAAHQNRGVVDSFHGDRFTVSFNAARPCASHMTRAALVALRIAREFDSAGQRTTSGVASGAAFVGNVGCAAMKRFSIVGPVVPQAAVLERMCKVYDATCLVAQRAFQELTLVASLRTHDLVQLPGSMMPCLIAAVLKEHATGDNDEWMYQLQRQERAAAGFAGHQDLDSDCTPTGNSSVGSNHVGSSEGRSAGGTPRSAIRPASVVDRATWLANEAWAAAAKGELAEVRRHAVLLRKLDAEASESATPLISARLCHVLSDAEADIKTPPRDLGVFYNDGFCC